MTHQQSISSGAVESYLFGELPPAERDEFEEHFFECPRCANDVRAAFRLRENAAAVFRAESQRKFRFRVPSWAAMAACLAIALLTGYQTVLHQQRSLALVEAPPTGAPTVLAPSSRSAVPSVAIPAHAAFLPLSLAPGAPRGAGRLEYRLRNESGATIWQAPAPPAGPDDNLTALVPAAALHKATYDLEVVEISGSGARDVDHYHFAVRAE
jgi:anti-sigma factor RsiW